MDSQAKYGCLVRGEGGAYLRMPTGVGYREEIWVSESNSYTYTRQLTGDCMIFLPQDHAPGQILVEVIPSGPWYGVGRVLTITNRETLSCNVEPR